MRTKFLVPAILVLVVLVAVAAGVLAAGPHRVWTDLAGSSQNTKSSSSCDMQSTLEALPENVHAPEGHTTVGVVACLDGWAMVKVTNSDAQPGVAILHFEGYWTYDTVGDSYQVETWVPRATGMPTSVTNALAERLGIAG